MIVINIDINIVIDIARASLEMSRAAREFPQRGGAAIALTFANSTFPSLTFNARAFSRHAETQIIPETSPDPSERRGINFEN